MDFNALSQLGPILNELISALKENTQELKIANEQYEEEKNTDYEESPLEKGLVELMNIAKGKAVEEGDTKTIEKLDTISDSIRKM